MLVVQPHRESVPHLTSSAIPSTRRPSVARQRIQAEGTPMLRAPVKVIAAAVTAAAIGGATITAASARMSISAARHGREHFTLMAALARTADASIHASIIGTGLFTDGG